MGVALRIGGKLWWMMWWRLSLLCVVVAQPQAIAGAAVAAGIGAFLLVRVWEKDISCFPLVRLLTRKPVMGALPHPAQGRTPAQSAPRTAVPATTQPWQTPTPTRTRTPTQQSWTAPPPPAMGETVGRPSGKGHLSGFEPSLLRAYHAPISIRAKGVAGLGLFSSGFENQNVFSGQQGEMGFYKALCMERLIDSCSSYWSVAMPAAGTAAVPDTKFTTDIDCVVVQGSTMYLIDLKYYVSGDVTWYSQDGHWLLCRDGRTGHQVGKPRKMSRNMAMAADRFPRIFPQLRVESYVVLIPTEAGLGTVQPGTVWPGGVPLINLTDMLAKLRQGVVGYADSDTDRQLMTLLKD